MFKIIHYRHKCIGCGICFEMQPQLWRMSKKDGKAVLLQSETKKQLYMLSVPSSEKDLSREVMNACPARIIKIM